MNARQAELQAAYLARQASQRALSPHTIKVWQYDIEKLSAFLARNNLDGWHSLTVEGLEGLIADCSASGLDIRSQQRLLSTLRSFYDWLVDNDAATSNPARSLCLKTHKRELPHVLDVDAMQALLDQPAPDDAYERALWIRDRAMMELFYSSGLRLSELAYARASDLDLAAGYITVTGKGKRMRRLPVGRKARAALTEWLARRPLWLGVDDITGERVESDGWLFITSKGQRFAERAIQLRLDYQARRASLPQHVHPHMLRHSFASHLLESSHDLRAVQELLGHADISTTQIYTHLDYQHLADTYDKAHPRSRHKSEV